MILLLDKPFWMRKRKYISLITQQFDNDIQEDFKKTHPLYIVILISMYVKLDEVYPNRQLMQNVLECYDYVFNQMINKSQEKKSE